MHLLDMLESGWKKKHFLNPLGTMFIQSIRNCANVQLCRGSINMLASGLAGK